MKKFVVGLSGYIASGKSTAAAYFAEFGAEIIDADAVVSELYKPGKEGYRKIYNFFGAEYFTKNGSLNRKKLAKEIFNDPKKLRILHALIHPLVTHYVQQLIDKSSHPFIVLEAVYFEKKYLQKLISALIWVDCPRELIFQRISTERKIDQDLFEKILKVQVKPESIDYVLMNDGSKSSLKVQVKALYGKTSPPP